VERSLIECVPNFSEGRDTRVVDQIVDAIAGTPGVSVLARESDFDHNRSVITFAGTPESVAAGAIRGIEQAVLGIDLTRHEGAHPRIGAVDVVPFVPIAAASLEQCVEIAHAVGRRVWELLRVPVYFYEAAALSPERVRLERVRRRGYHWLRDHVAQHRPDIGDAALHPTAGAIAIGARKLLIAFNANLTTADVRIAESIARKIRASSGGLPALKAIGVYLPSRGLAQVAMNLTDFEQTGLFAAFAAVQNEAVRHGTEIASTEIVGLVPRMALDEAAVQFLKCGNFNENRILENRIEAARNRARTGAENREQS
jgi:glutamate formiminotransferase